MKTLISILSLMLYTLPCIFSGKAAMIRTLCHATLNRVSMRKPAFKADQEYKETVERIAFASIDKAECCTYDKGIVLNGGGRLTMALRKIPCM